MFNSEEYNTIQNYRAKVAELVKELRSSLYSENVNPARYNQILEGVVSSIALMALTDAIEIVVEEPEEMALLLMELLADAKRDAKYIQTLHQDIKSLKEATKPEVNKQ
jgi:hypothetical protein